MMKANWLRMQGGEECAGVNSESYGQLGCACTFERGQLAAHLSDGANLCEACWNQISDLMEDRDGERPEIS